MKNRVALVLTVLAGSVAVGGASAQEAVPLDRPLIGEVALGAAPQAKGPRWVQSVELVWLEAEQRLIRRAYEVWQGPTEAGLLFKWAPDDLNEDQGGRVTGAGRLTWYEGSAADASPDDAAAKVVSYYDGTLSDGRRHGTGRYVHASGLTYDGAWSNDLMHGLGTLNLPDGSHYTGRFAQGQLHGKGVLVNSEGVVFEGQFHKGRAQGPGLVRRPDAQVHTALWQDGEELPGTRQIQRAAYVTDANFDDHLRVGVVLENQLGRAFGLNANRNTGGGLYRSYASGDRLVIRPGSERLTGVWMGTEPINLTADEISAYSASKTFLGIETADLKPISLVFELANDGREDIRIVDAAIEVKESRSLNRPMMQVVSIEPDCSFTRDPVDTTFLIENYGWAPVDTGTFRLTLGDDDSNALEVGLGQLDGRKEVDVAQALQAKGVDLNALRNREFCSPPQSSEPDDFRTAVGQCLQEMRSSGAFGPFVDSLEFSDQLIIARFNADLDFSWQDKGRAQNGNAYFSGVFTLGQHNLNFAECGEGGQVVDIAAKRPFMFRNDDKNYRIRVPLREVVPAGVTARWRLKFEAERNSRHDFGIVFQLSDGREVRSRPVDLMYFRPKEIE